MTNRTDMRLLLASLALGAVLAAPPAQAQAPAPIDTSRLGPQVGAAVPAFSAVDQFGKTQTLESLAGPNGLMLVFNRSVDW